MKLTRLAPIAWVCTPVISAIITVTTALVSPMASAQESAPGIEEVIVTARRIAESAQDVPVAITAFTEDEIKNMAPRTLRDFDGTVPNLFVSMNAASAQGGAIFLRGIGYAGTEKTQSPGVGIIIDGVQLGSNTGQLMDTFDIAQVEVNRGPQGVLFGKNTTGGTINITRIAPEFNEWGFAVSGLYGDYDEQTFKGRVNIPLIDDKLAMKIGFTDKQRDGFWDNINLGCSECAGDVDYNALTVAVRWAPTETLEAKFTYDKINDDSDIAPMDAFYSGKTPFITEANFDEVMEYEVDAVTLEINWETEIGTITSITGYRDSTDLVRNDFDGVTLNQPVIPLVQLHTNRDQDFEQFSQELRLSGSFNDNVSFTTGVYYYESEHKFFQNSATVIQLPNFGQAIDPTFSCLVSSIVLAPAFPFPNDNPALGNSLCQSDETRDIHIASEDVESLGIFGSVTWQATEQLELSFGARYIDEDKDFENAFFETTDPNNILIGTSVIDDDSWDDVIIKATAAYRFNPRVMVYASYAEGYLSGGYSIRGTQPAFATYEPEDVESWEVGVKSDFWDRRVRLNVTAFYTEQTDKQFLSIIGAPVGQAFPTTNTVVNNLPDTEIDGLEVELLVEFTDNFSVNFIGGIQDGEQKSFTIEGARIGQAPGPFDAPKSDIAFFPEWNWAITPTFQAQLGPGRFLASVTYKDQDEYIIGVNSLDFGSVFESGYSRLDARISYELPVGDDEILIISAFGKNLTDEEYREHQLDLVQPNSGFQGWGAPRTWAVEVLYQL